MTHMELCKVVGMRASGNQQRAVLYSAGTSATQALGEIREKSLEDEYTRSTDFPLCFSLFSGD